VIDSRRRHILRTEHLIGQSVQPRPEDVFIESQLRRAGQLSTIGEITTCELNESLIGKAEQLEVMRLVKVDPAVLETKVQFEPTFLVRLMGPVEVVDLAGNVVAFNRAKSVELLAWITQHRSAPRRSLARSAMWDAGVQDATFHNVVSEVRRGLNAASQEESPWISRSHDDHLELNDNVQSDSELLRETLNVCRSSSTSDNLLGLRQALSLVRGLPFAGTNYLWPDTEGITSNIVIMILEAAELIAENALEAREISDVFWATGQGLRVVQGHEGLVALRMRAHAVNHSKAGVESEWRSYLRAVQADSWSSGKPNPVLVDLHQSLLSS
jgi:two-component SAPR family response regulator